jgi:hypothetical protein
VGQAVKRTDAKDKALEQPAAQHGGENSNRKAERYRPAGVREPLHPEVRKQNAEPSADPSHAECRQASPSMVQEIKPPTVDAESAPAF